MTNIIGKRFVFKRRRDGKQGHGQERSPTGAFSISHASQGPPSRLSLPSKPTSKKSGEKSGLERLNAHAGPGRPRIEIGIGIHTGQLTAGNVGARDRLEYSVIGETVNLASRLEALTKDFKTPIIISLSTYELVQGQFVTAPIGAVQVRGFSGNLRVYSVQRDVIKP